MQPATPTTNSFINMSERNNPFFDVTSSPGLPFAELTPEHVSRAGEQTIAICRQKIDDICAIPPAAMSVENVVLAFDKLLHEFERVSSWLYLLAFVHPQSQMRDTAQETTTLLLRFQNEIALHQGLYQTINHFATCNAAQKLSPEEKKFVDETLRDFKRNGLGQGEEKLVEIKQIQDELAELGMRFSTNITAHSDHIILSEAQTKGLPADYLQQRKTDEGTYNIDLAYPSYHPFMRLCESDEKRKELYIKFMNKGLPHNREVLDQILRKRRELATTLGYASYADYSMETKMARNPQAAWDFEQQLLQRVIPVSLREYEELLHTREMLTGEKHPTIQPWQSAWLTHQTLSRKYKVDSETVKQYFVLENVVQGLFELSSRLFGITFRRIEGCKCWHEQVEMYAIEENGRELAWFYFDFFPREGKYNHAAMFSLTQARYGHEQIIKPLSALVCNFPHPTTEQPSLLTHNETETLFHEFGHLLHSLLSKSPIGAFAGTSVARDFVEAPSQCFENWAWEYDVLSLFARHYKTGEILPRPLFDRMLAARNIGTGIHTRQQIFYGLLDLSFHHRYDPDSPKTTSDIVRELQNTVTQFPYTEGTCFEAGFGHLNGYAAGYYGYLWAKVFAQDIFEQFQKNGIFDRETGMRYRLTILEKGSTKDEMQLLRDFLGRDPQNDAFVRSLTGETID